MIMRLAWFGVVVAIAGSIACGDSEDVGDEGTEGGATCEATPTCQLAEAQWCECCAFMCTAPNVCAGAQARDDDPDRQANCEMVAEASCDDDLWMEPGTCAVASGIRERRLGGSR